MSEPRDSTKLEEDQRTKKQHSIFKQEIIKLIPDDFVDILREFTVGVLRYKPPEIEAFAVDYFTKIQRSTLAGIKRPSLLERTSLPENKVKEKTNYLSKMSTADEYLSDGLTDEEYMTYHSEVSNCRRRSIAAERFDPDSENESHDSVELSLYDKTEAQRTLLINVCKNTLLFKDMELSQLRRVVDAMSNKNVVEDDAIINEGEQGDNFYVIESGIYEAFKHDEKSSTDILVKTYTNTGYFGELALMYNAPRACTIKAKTSGIIWALSRRSFKTLALRHAAKRRREFIKLLKSINILNELNDYEIMSLADALVKREYDAGDVIIKQGDEGLELFFIISGTANVILKDKDGNETQVGKRESNTYFGELALIRKELRTASVIAENKVVTAVLDVDSFERLLGPCVNLMRRHAKEYLKQHVYDNLTGNKKSVYL